MSQLMQLNKIKMGKNVTDTIIGDGLVFTNALLKGNGVIRIDGHYTGDIDVEGHIILSPSGVICGDITADSAQISGQCTGNLRIRNTLHLTSTADVEGKIEAGSLKIDEGAAFSAVCTIARQSERKNVALDGAKSSKALKEKTGTTGTENK